MPSILFEPLGEGGKYIVYEPPVTGPYKVLALVCIIFTAVLIGLLGSAVHRCPGSSQ